MVIHERENQKKFAVTLNSKNVEKAKELQFKLSGASNLSSLIDILLEEWIITESAFIDLRKKQLAKKKKSGLHIFKEGDAL